MKTIIRIVRGSFGRQLAVAVTVALALLLRAALAEQSISIPTYVIFYPIVCLAALLSGVWEGILATALSALFVDYFLLKPVGQFTGHSTSGIVGLAIFGVSGVSVSIVTEILHRNRERRAAHNIEVAVLSERRRKEEAGEPTDTASVKRLQPLDALESQPATNKRTHSSGAVPVGRKLSATGHDSRLPMLDQTRFRSSLGWALAVPLLGTLILAGAALWAAYDLNRSMQSVDRTDQVIGQSQHVFELLTDMENGQRGYLLMGKDVFLQPYQEASKLFDSEYRKLFLMVVHNPPQQTRLEKLYGNFVHWHGYADHMMALRRAGEPYTGLSVNLAGKGEMDGIREQLAEFQSFEEHLRDERNRRANRDWHIVLTICIVLGLGVGTVLAVFTLNRMEAIAASFEESGRALAASEKRFRAMVMASSDSVYRMSADWSVMHSLVGRDFIADTDEPIVNWTEKYIYPDDQERVWAVIREAIRTKGVFELEHRVRTIDGGLGWTFSRSVPLMDAKGEIVEWFGTASDITKRKQMEEALHRQATLIDITPDVFTVRHLDGTFTYWNRGAEALYGWSRNEAIGQRSHSLFQTRFPQDLKDIEEQLKRTGSWSGELIHRTKDGRTIVVQSKWLAQYDAHGEVTEVLVSNADITARKQAERQLRELNQELEDRVHQRTAELEAVLVDRSQSEQRFITLANFVPQLVWMCTPDGLNVYFNRRWVEYTGLTLEESCGNGWNTSFHPDEKQIALDAWNHAMQTGESYRVESRLRAANGSYRWFLMLGEALRDADGSIVRWFGTCTDIADMKQAEEALCRSQRRLEEANNELQSFSYSVSHDLRGPLRTMDGFSQALLEDHSQNLDEKGRHFVTRIRTAAQRMGRLIDDLLRLSRLNRAEMRVRPVDLSAMALALIDELRDNEPGRNVEVQIEPGLETRGDPGLLQVALQNLLSNAWKFTSRRESAVIEFSRVDNQPNSAFFVRDNGAGFDMKYADHLFSPFQRLHADEEFKGTGIGLATVQRIICRHSGRIWAEAAEGQGATFYFQLGF